MILEYMKFWTKSSEVNLSEDNGISLNMRRMIFTCRDNAK